MLSCELVYAPPLKQDHSVSVQWTWLVNVTSLLFPLLKNQIIKCIKDGSYLWHAVKVIRLKILSTMWSFFKNTQRGSNRPKWRTYNHCFAKQGCCQTILSKNVYAHTLALLLWSSQQLVQWLIIAPGVRISGHRGLSPESNINIIPREAREISQKRGCKECRSWRTGRRLEILPPRYNSLNSGTPCC